MYDLRDAATGMLGPEAQRAIAHGAAAEDLSKESSAPC